MSDAVKINIQETPWVVRILDNTPVVTITNNETAQVSVTQAKTAVSVNIDDQPKVTVNMGIGGTYDISSIINSLLGKVTFELLAPPLQEDILHIRELWEQYDGGMLSVAYHELLYNHDLFISEGDARLSDAREPLAHAFAGTEHTASTLLQLNTKISDATLVDAQELTDLQIYLEGLITPLSDQIVINNNTLTSRLDDTTYVDDLYQSNYTQITQTAYEIRFEAGQREEWVDEYVKTTESSLSIEAGKIDARVTALTTDHGNLIASQSSRITQTEKDIVSAVEDLRLIDGTGGFIEEHRSKIDQTAYKVDITVEQRFLDVEGDIIDGLGEISVEADKIELLVKQVHDPGGLNERIEAAEINIQDDHIILSAVDQKAGDNAYKIGTTQTILRNHWGVEIKYDSVGQHYSTGFGLTMLAPWSEDDDYSDGSVVLHNGVVYRCTWGHMAPATAEYEPPNTAAWVEDPDADRSAFIVDADAFKVYTTAGPVPMFEVTTTGVQIAGDVTIGVSQVDGAFLGLDALDPEQQESINTFIKNAGVGVGGTTIITADGYIRTSLIQTNAISIGDFYDSGALAKLDNITWAYLTGPVPDQDSDNTSGALVAGALADAVLNGVTVVQNGLIQTDAIAVGNININDLANASTFESDEVRNINGVVASVLTAQAAEGKALADDFTYTLNINDLMEWAFKGNTIISGGYIQTGLINTSAIAVGDLSDGTDILTYLDDFISAYDTAGGDTATAKAADIPGTVAWLTGNITNALLNGYTFISGGLIKASMLLVDTAQIKELAVDTLQVAGNAITFGAGQHNPSGYTASASITLSHSAYLTAIGSVVVRVGPSTVTLAVNGVTYYSEQPAEETLACMTIGAAVGPGTYTVTVNGGHGSNTNASVSIFAFMK